MRYLLKT